MLLSESMVGGQRSETTHRAVAAHPQSSTVYEIGATPLLKLILTQTRWKRSEQGSSKADQMGDVLCRADADALSIARTYLDSVSEAVPRTKGDHLPAAR